MCMLLISMGLLSFSFVEDGLFSIAKNLDIFASIYKEINLSYIDEVDTSRLIRTGIDAMLGELDPYTQYVSEAEMEAFRLTFLSSEYDGIGARIGAKNGRIFISEIFENFPAQKADIWVGDEILKINGVSLNGKSPDEASNMLKGAQNTTLKLLISRVGVNKLIEKKIIRKEIKQGNIPYYGFVSGDIGYIKLDKFQTNSGQEVADALFELKKEKLYGLILDLRDNGGGMVAEAIKIVNLFVDRNTKVAVQKGRTQEQTAIYQTKSDPIAPNLPLVVLVNNNSASASEIVAGALQDLDRAVIVGERSFGKGLVQQTINMPYNSLIKITIAKYCTPSGRCIQALDYKTHRDTDGNVIKVADSLIKEFKTKAGRSVYDGNGIYPDVFVAPIEYHYITKVLVNKDFIFDYATKFRSEHPSIVTAKKFKLDDAMYGQFRTYLSSKDYNYDTPTEETLHLLHSQAKSEGKFEAIKSELEVLQAKVYQNKKNDLNQFSNEIKQTLEGEIVSRYYFQRGRFEQGLQYDREVQVALKLFREAIISPILAGSGTYKTIGKPSLNSLIKAKAR